MKQNTHLKKALSWISPFQEVNEYHPCRQKVNDGDHLYHLKVSDACRPCHRKVSGRRYCSEVGRSYCSWVGTSFLIDLPYINHTQAAKQDAKLWLRTWQKYQNEGQYPRTFI